MGVLRSLIATSTCGVHLPRRAPNSTLRSVLGVPPALDGLLHHRPRGFVSSHSHVQGTPFRGLATPQSRARFPRPLPSCRFNHRACLSEEWLQHDALGSRALLPTVSATTSDRRLTLPERHAPLGFSSPPGTLIRAMAAPSRFLRPRPWSRRALRDRTLGVSTARTSDGLEPHHPPCTRFLA
jgi:hypothetical protein